MNTNMNEISINEMDEISGGVCGLAIAACVVAAVTAAIKITDFVYDCATGQ